MQNITPQKLDQVELDEAQRLILRRFPRLKGYRAFIAACLEWQQTCDPRPNFYFRWHLPRFITTCELVARVTGAMRDPKILDIGSYGPFAILMNGHLSHSCPNIEWTRTGYDDGVDRYRVGAEAIEVPFVKCNLNDSGLPFDSNRFDVVILGEVIEHVHLHPQAVLAETNRVLRDDGVLVLTTPNSSSLKKIMQITNGVPEFDSATFGGPMGHRYEYSYYTMRECITRTGFTLVSESARDVYFDDPAGITPRIELAGNVFTKLASRQVRSAVKLIRRRGSTLLFVARKSGTPPVNGTSYISI